MKKGLRLKVRLLLGVLLAGFFLLAMPARAEAAGSGYFTNSYSVQTTVSENHVFHVKETIQVDFYEARHGIYRYIPYQSNLYEIKNIHVPGQTFKVSGETRVNDDGTGSGYKVIRIGNKDKTVTGAMTYTIEYDLVSFKDPDTDADYLAIDLFPPNWETSVPSFSASLSLPKSVDPSVFHVYYGAAGSKDEADPNGTIQSSISEDGTRLQFSGSIPPKYGITVRATLPDNYWVKPATHNYAIILWILVLIGFPAISILLWFFGGRDPKIVETVEFYPPENLTPAEIGYLIDGKLDPTDMSAMLLYYASKGYIKIHEYEKNKFRLSRTEKGGELKGEKRFSKTLFNGMFKDGHTDSGEEHYVYLDKMPENYGESLSAASSALKNLYSGKNGVYTKRSKFFRFIASLLSIFYFSVGGKLAEFYSYKSLAQPISLIFALMFMLGVIYLSYVGDRYRGMSKSGKFFGILIGLLLWVIGLGMSTYYISYHFNHSGLLAIAMLIGGILLTVMTVLMKARTKRSAELLGKILGFQNFIKLAEYDRLKLLSDEDPEYFYHIMPYAYVLGMSTVWAEKFMKIQIAPPTWYSGYDGGYIFTPLWYGHFTTHAAQGFTHSFYNLPDSGDFGSFGGGGGFSGGGFSGGGFGGGGGGSW